jgi:hypothetical protein
LQLVLDTYNLDQIIHFPTRTSIKSISLIGNFFLDRNGDKNFLVYPVINGLSDHDGQILTLNNLQVIKQIRHKYTYREINKEIITKFQISLRNENWEEVYDHENVNSKGKAFPLQAWTGPWGSRRLRLQNF